MCEFNHPVPAFKEPGKEPRLYTLNDLYRMSYTGSTCELDALLMGGNGGHIAEVRCNHFDVEGLSSERIETRFIVDHNIDGRRIWRLATVWLDGEPVMVIQNAGREGRDFCARFITDEERFVEMIRLIEELEREINYDKLEITNADEPSIEFTAFYSNALDSFVEF